MLPFQVCVKSRLSGFRVAAGRPSIMDGMPLQYGRSAHPLPRTCHLRLFVVASSSVLAASRTAVRSCVYSPPLPSSQVCVQSCIFAWHVATGRLSTMDGVPLQYGRSVRPLPSTRYLHLFAVASSSPLLPVGRRSIHLPTLRQHSHHRSASHHAFLVFA